MRIAVVHSVYSSDTPSGENIVVALQVEALARSGHDVTLISRRTDDLRGRLGYAAGSALTAATGLGRDAYEELTRIDPDVVHVHNVFPNFGTRSLEPWASRSVFTLHNFRTVCAAGTLFRDGRPCSQCISLPVLPAIIHACYRDSRLATGPVAIGAAPSGGLRRALSIANTVIALNPAAATLFERYAKRVAIVPNFVSQPEEVFQTPSRESRWLYVGRLEPEKGLPTLLRVWPPEVPLDVIGDGTAKIDAIREAEGRQLDVRWLGALSHAETLRFTARALGLVVPSLWGEGVPTVVLEALARHIPLAFSDRVSIGSEIAISGAAKIFDVSDPLSVKAALRIASMPTARASARALYDAEFSEAVWLGRTEEEYRRVTLGRSVS